MYNLICFIICAQCIAIALDAIALDNSALHDSTLNDLPKSLLIKKPFNNVEKVIQTDSLKSFDLEKKNKLYTNSNTIIGFANILNRIILAQDNLFKLKSKPYNIVLINNPNLSHATGVAEKDYIVVEGPVEGVLEGDFAKDDYIRVVSHELIHRYIGHIIKQDQENELKYKWFFEGFTEFYGVKTLLDIKFINEDGYLKIVNDILEEYFNSLIRDINFEKMNEKNLSYQDIDILNYNKGFILAMIIDENLKRVSNRKYNLQDVINKVSSGQNHFNLETFTGYLKLHLPESFIEQFLNSIYDSSVLVTLLPQKLLNENSTFNLTFKVNDKYGDICFNLTKSMESRMIHGVELDSDCYNSGLRNDQELKCCSVDFNSGNIKLKILENKEVVKTIELKAKKITHHTPVYEHLK